MYRSYNSTWEWLLRSFVSWNKTSFFLHSSWKAEHYGQLRVLTLKLDHFLIFFKDCEPISNNCNVTCVQLKKACNFCSINFFKDFKPVYFLGIFCKSLTLCNIIYKFYQLDIILIINYQHTRERFETEITLNDFWLVPCQSLLHHILFTKTMHQRKIKCGCKNMSILHYGLS